MSDAKEPKPCKGQAGFLILGAAIAIGATWLDEIKQDRKATRDFERFQKWYVTLPKCKEEAVKPVVPPQWPKKPIGSPVGASDESE